MTTKLLMTPKEAAEMLGISQDMLDAVGVPFVPIRGRGTGLWMHRRYSRPALLAWLAAQGQQVAPTLTLGGAR